MTPHVLAKSDSQMMSACTTNIVYSTHRVLNTIQHPGGAGLAPRSVTNGGGFALEPAHLCDDDRCRGQLFLSDTARTFVRTGLRARALQVCGFLQGGGIADIADLCCFDVACPVGVAAQR